MKKHTSGLSFIELLITLSLISIIISFAIGFNQQLLLKHYVVRLEKNLIHAIEYSRHQALLSGHDLTLSALPPDDDWSKGLILFADNPAHRYNQHEKVYYRWHWHHYASLQIEWHGFQSSSYLIFSPQLQHATLSGHFDIVHDGIVIKRIVLNRMGSISVRNK